MSTNPPVVNVRDERADTLGKEITRLYGLITAATYEFLVRVREFDAEELWAGPGMASCAHWLNWQCGIGMNAAREKVRVARALGDLPKISDAFRRGEVSFSKVRAMTRVATPESEDYLLMISKHGTAHHVESLVRGFRRAVRLSEPDSAEHQFDTRSFDYHWGEDGSLAFKGRLPAEVGAMLLKALQCSIDRRGKEVYPKGTSTAVKVPFGQTSDDEEPDSYGSLSQRRADAIAEMAEAYLETGPAKSSSADRYQVMVHFHPEGTSYGGASSHIENGPHVTAETSKRLCCDTSISRIVEDGKGEPLSIGRKSRVIPPAMRRALIARDKHCRFPGCTHGYFVDGHHIEHWAEKGETALDNLALLCRTHHRMVHEGGFRCEKDDDKVIFFDPADRLIPPSGKPPRFRGRRALRVNVIAHLKEKLEDRFIDEQTIRPEWHGETMDNCLAVGHLWDIEHRDALPR